MKLKWGAFAAEAKRSTVKQLERGTYSTWNDRIGIRGFKDTFGTVNLRRGPGSSLIEQIAAIGADADLSSEESIAKTIARPLAQFRATYLDLVSVLTDQEKNLKAGKRSQVSEGPGKE